MQVCDVFTKISRTCTAVQEDTVRFLFDSVSGVEARRHTIGGGPDARSALAVVGRSHYVAPFTKTVDQIITLRVPRSVALQEVLDTQSLDHILGVRLAVSSRRDFRACVSVVAPTSAAERMGIQAGALVVSVDGRSVRGLGMEQVKQAICAALVIPAPEPISANTAMPGRVTMNASRKAVSIEFSQSVEEMRVDNDPFQMTSFPSPVGQHLPGVKEFLDFECHRESAKEVDQPPTLRRRERSRSMKHFWMSDRSSKACYECDQLFTFFRRRHHCRSCGQIFCSQCCARLPQSFGGTKVDATISRLRKQLVCHTCHRQLREGLEVELTGGNQLAADGSLRQENSQASQTLLLMPPQIAEALERSSTDATHYKKLDKSELVDKDEMSNDEVSRTSEQIDKMRPSRLFKMFPKVQIVASVQQLTHQPRLQGVSSERPQAFKSHRRKRAVSLSLNTIRNKDTRKGELVRSLSKLKRSNSLSEIGNPSSHGWSEAEFKRLVEASGTKTRASEAMVPTSSKLFRPRPKAMSGNFSEPQFGKIVTHNSFDEKHLPVSKFRQSISIMDADRYPARDSRVLRVVGLSEDAIDDSVDSISIARREDALRVMKEHARARIEERIFHLLESAPALSRLPIMEQHKWMQIIHLFAVRAATTVMCEPDQGDSMDVMEYVRVKSLDGGRVQDSFFIDGVLLHKSLARKGMRCDIANPRILLIASELDYQRNKEAIASLESVAGQEIEYMHIVAEKILTKRPDIVMFSGHVHRVAEEILFKEGVAVIKNVRMVDLQRIARSTGASLLTSYDHVDKIADKAIMGKCKRFYVMLSDYEPKSAQRFAMQRAPNGMFNVKQGTSSVEARRKRPQRQNIVFEGGITSRGCTICLRGGSLQVFDEVTRAMSVITRAAYNMRLQRCLLVEYGYQPLREEQLDRSVAEEWFAKCATSLYISLKSNSLSMRAALKETQSMCKWCKEHTRYNNISSMRGVGREGGYPSSQGASNTSRWNPYDSTPSGCTCTSRSSDALRERILFSTCWSSLDGMTASKAEMMCIDFYSTNDCSVGQFLTKYCLGASDREFKRAFGTSKLTFSHDVGRVTVRVKDLSEFKDLNERQMRAAALLRDLNHRAVLRKIRSDTGYMWTRCVDVDGNSSTPLAARFAPIPDDMWNYSFGKFLEDMLYGKSMNIDTVRFPHLTRVQSSRDASLVHYFSRGGFVVSVQCEPVEPVLHVALQPVLWQDHVDHHQQITAIQELCELAQDVYTITTAKVTESMDDPVTPPHAKAYLRILRNEVQQWYSCYASKIESDPPDDIFTKNSRFKDIYKHAADWSLRITKAMQATVKPIVKYAESSPKSALPRAWFDQLSAGQETTQLGSPPIQFQETVSDMAGNLENLARFARSLAAGEVSAPSGFSNISNEVTNTLMAAKRHSGGIELSDVVSNDDREDSTSRSVPQQDGSGTNSYFSTGNVGTTTIGSYSSRLALDRFRRTQRSKKIDPWGYLTIPKRLLDWHPSLPSGVKDTAVLVNASQPTSVVAYSLSSKEYAQQISGFIRKESILSSRPMSSTLSNTANSVETTMLRMLRSTRRNNVDHMFVDDTQFQLPTRFSCKSYYAMQFHALRQLYYGGDRNYVESLCNCEQWNAAGGKSGAGFLKTQDQRFIAKAIPEIELQMFLSMANEYFGYMAKTFENNLSSMLSKVLGIYKVAISSDTERKMCVIVMENLLYGREVNVSFDLKGKMEGRYRQHTMEDSGAVLWDRNFVEMTGGIPLPLQESAMSLLLSAIANDTAFLASVQVTDYSMLVGYDVKKQEIVACIIDYIHKYDFLKMVEHAGKRLIQDEGEITVLNPRQYRKRFCLAMTKYFVTIPSRYTTVMTIKHSLKDLGDDETTPEVSPAIGAAHPRRLNQVTETSAAFYASSASSNASTVSVTSTTRV